MSVSKASTWDKLACSWQNTTTQRKTQALLPEVSIKCHSRISNDQRTRKFRPLLGCFTKPMKSQPVAPSRVRTLLASVAWPHATPIIHQTRGIMTGSSFPRYYIYPTVSKVSAVLAGLLKYLDGSSARLASRRLMASHGV